MVSEAQRIKHKNINLKFVDTPCKIADVCDFKK